jgi:hypothetical protein
MSLQYYGTYPVKKKTNSYVDQNGIQFSSMQIIAQQSDAASYVPTIGSAYEYDASMAVTRTDVNESANGLTEISVTAAGPASNAKPFYRIIPGAPYIYGLKREQNTGTWTTLPESNSVPYYSNNPANKQLPLTSPDGGIYIEVTFVSSEQNRQSIIDTYYKKVMPDSINGLSLPTPTSGPVSFEKYRTRLTPGVPYDISIIEHFVQYNGFVCKNMRLELTGSALLVILNYMESGFGIVAVGDKNITSFSY